MAIFRIVELDVLVSSQEGPKTGMRLVDGKDPIDAAHKFYEAKPDASDHILIVAENSVDEHWRNPNNVNYTGKRQ